MRNLFTSIICLCIVNISFCQAVYTSANYANIGDTIFLTGVKIDSTNYLASGPSYTWRFDTLKPESQQQLVFSNPKNSSLNWPYIKNNNNVNISSANGLSFALGAFTISNKNEYFLKSTNAHVQRASSYYIAYKNFSYNVQNVYTANDSIYRFPIHYNDTLASVGGFTTTIPNIYYNNEKIERTNKVDGWGTLITPYGTYNNCLRVVSNVIQTDTFALNGIGIPSIVSEYRELRWIDTTKGYPVLFVKQSKISGYYITQNVQFLDSQRYFQPNALFAYVPPKPAVGDTITFQNLSSNATKYLWNFGDNTTSTETNPQHYFSASGTYSVSLIAYNGALSDTTTISIQVSNQPTALFGYYPVSPVVNDTITFQNLSINGVTYLWNFGDGTATSSTASPKHVYTNAGTFNVTLIAYNNGFSDTITVPLHVSSVLATKITGFNVVQKNNTCQLQWETESESNLSAFKVERSLDGITFESIASIPSKGSFQLNNSYSFNDLSVGTYGVFYRLKAINKDGTFMYSNIVHLKLFESERQKLLVFPNPIALGNNAQLLLYSNYNQDAEINIINTSGKLMYSRKIHLTNGNNTVIMNTNQLNAGAYFINCTYKGTANIFSGMLIVK